MKGIATFFASLGVTLVAGTSFAQEKKLENLAELSLEELMRIEVTSVSRTPEKISTAPAAVTVITSGEIRRSGATSIPDVLRTVPGLQVAQLDANEWAISSRGFNDLFANKLLVMMDGRTIYTPLFSGVFWEVQDTMMEDIERIEVVRGPGATLWGANAVNGVINIITKSAKDTQGVLFSGGGGTEELGFGSVRYGGKLKEDIFLRVYGKYAYHDDFKLANGSSADDAWQMGRTGFRLDWEPATENTLTAQGDIYYGEVEDADVSGGNVLGRWTHRFSEDSEMSLQAYYDDTRRRFSDFQEDRNTEDVDFQHWFHLGERQKIVWGGGFRRTADSIQNSSEFNFNPTHRASELFSCFAQDEIALIQDKLFLTVGSKFEHNDFTGFEIQPSARLLWTPVEHQSIWASISRTVRTPSRAEDDILLNNPGNPTITGTRNFDSEKMIAYELGYRVQPLSRLSIEVATFYNDYDDLRSLEPISAPPITSVIVANGLMGETYGCELAATFQAAEPWRLSSGYTFLQMQIHRKAGSFDSVTESNYETASPQHQFFLHSSLDLGRHFEIDSTVRYVDTITVVGNVIPSYLTLDLRLAWKPNANWELALVGRNLLDSRHPEFAPTFTSGQQAEVERSVYAKVTWRF